LDVFSRLSQEDALDYKKWLCSTDTILLSMDINSIFTRWNPKVRKVQVSLSYDLRIILQSGYSCWKQFFSSCSKELTIYLMERNPKDLKELSDLAEHNLIAHGKKLSARTSHDGKKTYVKNMAFNKDKQVLRCFSCQGVGHRAVDCLSTSKSEENRWWSKKDEALLSLSRNWPWLMEMS